MELLFHSSGWPRLALTAVPDSRKPRTPAWRLRWCGAGLAQMLLTLRARPAAQRGLMTSSATEFLQEKRSLKHLQFPLRWGSSLTTSWARRWQHRALSPRSNAEGKTFGKGHPNLPPAAAAQDCRMAAVKPPDFSYKTSLALFPPTVSLL